MDASALDVIWACLFSGQRLRLEELASETGLPQAVVAEVIGFLVQYDLVSIAPDSSSVMIQGDAMSPHVLAMILEALL